MKIRLLAGSALITAIALALIMSGGSSRHSRGFPLSTATPAQFSRVTYTNSTSAIDARRFQVLDLGADASPTLVASIHKAHPGVKVLGYFSPFAQVPSSYFLHTATGAIVTTGTEQWLDPGNPSAQALCINAMLAEARRGGFDGIFLDQLNVRLNYGGEPECPGGAANCQSDGAMQASLTGFLRAAASRLHARGLLLIGNVSGAYGSYQPLWRQWGAILDGAMEESWGYGTDRRPIPQGLIVAELQNAAWSEAHLRYVLANGDLPANSETASSYGLGLALLVARGRTSWNVSEGNYGSYAPWYPEYTQAQKLGRPATGSYHTEADGLYVRRFANGTVAVNATAGPIADPTYGLLAAHSAAIKLG
jgi:Hypothetical glycosyl hydrolase family 15